MKTITLKVEIPAVQEHSLKKIKKMLDKNGRVFATWNLNNWKSLGFKSERAFKIAGDKDFRKTNMCPPEAHDIYDQAFQEISKRSYSSSIIIFQTQSGEFAFNSCPANAENQIMSIIDKCGGRWFGIIMSWVL